MSTSSTNSQPNQLHFLLIPLMSHSHIITLIDFAKLLAHHHGVNVSIVTTHANAQRYNSLARSGDREDPTEVRNSDCTFNFNIKIQLVPLYFPCEEFGSPKDCENMDSLPSIELYKEFFMACETLKEPVQEVIENMETKPNCVISTGGISWAQEVADKFKIPRYVFQTISCFTLLSTRMLKQENVGETLDSKHEGRAEKTLILGGETTGSRSDDMKSIIRQLKLSHDSGRGTLINTFEELEPGYIDRYKKIMNNVFCIGPVSLCNNKEIDEIVNRGNNDVSINEHSCLKWLDSMKPKSVIYASFGSLCHISFSQIKEIGLGLESSNVPFIWIIRGLNVSLEVEKWLSDENFEEKVKGRGLVIKGWAPQLLILSHPSIGGFLTHCGWNSTLEGITRGVPMITFPMFGDQFYNETLIVNVLKIGVRVRIEEKDRVLVMKDQIKKAIDDLLDEGDQESEERRKRAKEVAIMSKEAMQESGSSYLNIKLLIQDVIMYLVNN